MSTVEERKALSHLYIPKSRLFEAVWSVAILTLATGMTTVGTAWSGSLQNWGLCVTLALVSGYLWGLTICLTIYWLTR